MPRGFGGGEGSPTTPAGPVALAMTAWSVVPLSELVTETAFRWRVCRHLGSIVLNCQSVVILRVVRASADRADSSASLVVCETFLRLVPKIRCSFGAEVCVMLIDPLAIRTGEDRPP